MNAVGIDVSKGKSMVCVMRPFGEVVLEPFEVLHTAQNLHDLAEKLKALDGETRVVLEATGNYHKPVAFVLHDAGLFVSVVNPVLIHDYDNNCWSINSLTICRSSTMPATRPLALSDSSICVMMEFSR